MDTISFIKNKVAEAGSQTAISRKTGVSQGTIAKICNGDTTPEMGTIAKIARAYGLPLSYFLEDYPDPPHGIPGAYEAPAFERTIPVISMVQAGDNGYWVGPYPEQQGMERIPYPSSIKDPNAFAVKVEGNSMNPRYYAGEIVICDTTKPISNKDDVVIKFTDGRAMLKQWRSMNGTISLESINPAYDPIPVNEQDIRYCYKVVCRL